MREVADRERIGAFMTLLARHATADVDVFLVGGTRTVLVGWRATTIDVDLVFRPESDAMLRAIPMLKERLQLNVDLASDCVRAECALMEPELFRFPAIDPPSFRRAVDAVFPPSPP